MKENKTVSLSPFSKGMNNVQKESKLPEGSLDSAINVDIGDTGVVRRRERYKQIYTGINLSCLYRRFFVENDNLCKLLADNTAQVVNGDITSFDISYTQLNNETYYTDGTYVYSALDHKRIGLQRPSFYDTTVHEGTGLLRAGEYQISLCFVRPSTGEFSGATNFHIVTVDKDNSSIELTNIDQGNPNESYSINVYLSDTNGSELYHYVTVLSGTSTVDIKEATQNKHRITTLNMMSLIGGEILNSFNGRLYVAKDKTLYYSQALWYGLYKPSTDFYSFSAPITNVLIVDDGVYVTADKTYFIQGNDPTNASLREVSNLQGIKGTGLTLDASYFNLEYNGKVAYWMSNKGGVIGLPGGTIQEFSKDRLAVPKDITQGSATYIEHDGIHKVITSLSTLGNDTLNTLGASDNATAKIIRNGVVIA